MIQCTAHHTQTSEVSENYMPGYLYAFDDWSDVGEVQGVKQIAQHIPLPMQNAHGPFQSTGNI